MKVSIFTKYPKFVGCLIIVLSWLAGLYAFAKPSHQSLLDHLNPESLNFTFQLLDQHRVVLPTPLALPFLYLYLFSGLILLLAIYLISQKLISPYIGMAFPLILTASLASHSLIGSPPHYLFEVLLWILLIIPLLIHWNFFMLWLLSLTAAILLKYESSYQFALFWLCFSLLVGPTLKFILVDRLHPSRSLKVDAIRRLPLLIAYASLGYWVISLTLNFADSNTHLTPGKEWPLTVIIFVETLTLAWIKPWSTQRWLSINTFSLGTLLSTGFVTPLTLTSIALGFEIIFDPSVQSRLLGLMTTRFKKTLGTLMIFASIGMIAYPYSKFKLERLFNREAVKTLRKVVDDPAEGTLVVSNGLSFFAHFVPGNIVVDDNLLFETEEEELARILKASGISRILVDRNYLNQFWKDWIARGELPAVSNYSVITRAIFYEGKAVQTMTIDLKALKELSTIPLKNTDSYALIELKKNDSKN